MTQKFNSIIDELRHYLTLQHEAYLSKDENLYDQLEAQIWEIEHRL